MTEQDKKLLTAALGERCKMISETKRRVLAAACNKKWHHITDHCVAGVWKHWWMCDCGERFGKEETAYRHVNNPTFTTAQDWEDLLEKVVRPNIIKFDNFLWDIWDDLTNQDEDLQKKTELEWFLTLSIEERCELVAKFCIYMHEQGAEGFEFAKKFVGKEEGYDYCKCTMA